MKCKTSKFISQPATSLKAKTKDLQDQDRDCSHENQDQNFQISVYRRLETKTQVSITPSLVRIASKVVVGGRSSGPSLARRIWANILPGTDKRVIRRWLPHSFPGPIPMYNDSTLPFFHSAETFPDFQTTQNGPCNCFANWIDGAF